MLLILSWGVSAFAQSPSSGVSVAVSGAAAPPAVVNIWPRIPFTRGKDLCEYHDAYGRTKREQMGELTQTVRSLLREGVDSRNLVALLSAMDDQVNQQRKVASSNQQQWQHQERRRSQQFNQPSVACSW